MDYSKIKEIILVNFMCFKYTKVVFDESNILNIKGYNDSGKSAILRGVAVCLADMFKRAQGKFIRYGADFFRIIVTFEDGVSIKREKYSTGQSVYEMYKDDKLVYTTKQGSHPTRIEGVPTVIQEYLGLCMTDSGCLNYQSCSNKLFLGETTGSENYQELNTVLKSEELSRASVLINSDRNELNQKLIEMENELRETNAVLKSRSDVDEDLIDELILRDDYLDLYDERQNILIDIGTCYDKLETLEDLPALNPIDTRSFSLISSMLRDSVSLNDLQPIPELNPIPVDRITGISGISAVVEAIHKLSDIPKLDMVDTSRYNMLNSMVHDLRKFDKHVDYPEVSIISTSRYKAITDIMSMEKDVVDKGKMLNIPVIPEIGIKNLQKRRALMEVLDMIKKIASFTTDIEDIDATIEGFREDIRTSAEYNEDSYVICPNCGTYISVA